MTLEDLPIPLPFAPMEAKRVDRLPDGPGWRFEPKWDGFRCLAYRAGPQVELRAKSGKSLTRFFPEMVAALTTLEPDPFVVDGELLIQIDGRFEFDALQARLHPAASRILRLANDTPAELVLFDCLMTRDGKSLVEAPLAQRRSALETLVDGAPRTARIRLSPGVQDRAVAQAWLAEARNGLDGVIAKALDLPYRSGERAMLKVKRVRTADCVIGGFRYAADSDQVGSLLLGLYDASGRLNHVGFTSSFAHIDRPDLTRRLEALAPGEGFTGDAPGGPSRWSTERSAAWTPLRPALVVEVRYDQVTAGRFRHGTTLVRWRPDKRPDQCTCDQLQ